MNKSKLIPHSLLHALGVLGYIALVAFVMNYANNAIPRASGIIVIIPMLLLLVFSAAIMGVLVFGRPTFLFMNGHKKAAIQFLIYTMGWLLVILIIALISVFVIHSGAPYGNY